MEYCDEWQQPQQHAAHASSPGLLLGQCQCETQWAQNGRGTTPGHIFGFFPQHVEAASPLPRVQPGTIASGPTALLLAASAPSKTEPADGNTADASSTASMCQAEVSWHCSKRQRLLPNNGVQLLLKQGQRQHQQRVSSQLPPAESGSDPSIDDFLADDWPPQQQPPNGLQTQFYAGMKVSTEAAACTSQPVESQAYSRPNEEGTQPDKGEAAGNNGVDTDVQLVFADFDLSRNQVIERIEQLASQLVSAAAAGQLPTLTCISTSAANVHMAEQHAAVTGMRLGSSPVFDLAFASGMGDGREQQQQQQHCCEVHNDPDDMLSDYTMATAAAAVDESVQQQVLCLGSKTQTRTLTGNGGAQAHGIVRVLQLLAAVHSLLRTGRTATQRDLYYTLLGPPFFNTSSQLTSTIHTALALLRLPRAALGIAAASKGAVAGKLLLRFRPGEPWQDCSLTGTAGRAIPGEVGAIQAMQIRLSGARFILVVEKDAVFQRLVEDRLFDKLPCIIITGRGMPDVASRAFLAAVVAAAGQGTDAVGSSLPVLGLVDWNPAGVAILLSYRHGSAAMGLEAARYAVPALAWLGVTSDMLQDVPGSSCQPLTQRDKAQLSTLKLRLDSCPTWTAELEEMEGHGLKVDIEALYGVLGHAGLAEELVRRVLQRQYLR